MNHNLRITMLGTGNATVTKCYNTCFLLSENEEYFMVDAGGGNQILSILEDKKVPLTKIHDLFITLFDSRMEFIPIKDGDCHRILNRTFKFFDIGSTKLLQYAFEIPEEKLLFCGDEPLKDELLSKANGVKYIIHEAF